MITPRRVTAQFRGFFTRGRKESRLVDAGCGPFVNRLDWLSLGIYLGGIFSRRTAGDASHLLAQCLNAFRVETPIGPESVGMQA